MLRKVKASTSFLIFLIFLSVPRPGFAYKDSLDLVAESEEEVEDLYEMGEISFYTYREWKDLVEEEEFVEGDFRTKFEDNLSDGKTALLYQRLRLTWKENLSFGQLTERDKGEEEFAGLFKKYASFQSDKYGLVIGNYRASFGEGLVLKNYWREGGEAIGPDETTRESFLFEGLGFRLSRGNLDSHFLYSRQRMDARYEDEEVEYLSPGEDALEDELGEELWGVNLNYRLHPHTFLGATWYGADYSPETRPLLGWRKETWGINLETRIKNLQLSGEFAQVKNEGKGFLVRAQTKIEDLEILGIIRNYEEDFNNPRSYGFSDPDGEDNDRDEAGAYLEMTYKINPRWRIYTYYDQWKHYSDLTTDREAKAKLEHRLSPKIKISASRKWKDEDIEREKGRRITSLARLSWLPGSRTRLAFLYYHLQKDVTKYPDTMQVDNYAYGKGSFRLNKKMTLEGRLKFKDIDREERGGETSEYYLQWKNSFGKNWKGLIKYTNTAEAGEAPEEKIKVQIDHSF